MPPRRDTPICEPWDRQPGESARAYWAFCAYRDLDPDQRSVLEAYRQATGRPEARWPPGGWTKWCSKWDWVERAAEWDTMRARETARDEIERIRDERRAAARQRIQVSKAVMGKALQALQHINPEKLTATEAARLLDLAHKLQRESFPEAEPPEVFTGGGQDSISRLEELCDLLMARVRGGDLDAARTLVMVEERIAKAQGTDAPERHVHGLEGHLDAMFGGQSLANLSAETRARIAAELDPGEVIDGEYEDADEAA